METNSFHNGLDIDFLHEISSRMAAAADPLHQALARIVDFVSALIKCDSCFVNVLEGEELVLRAWKNPHQDCIDRLKLRVGQGITGWVAERASPSPLPRMPPKMSAARLATNCPRTRTNRFCASRS